MVFSNCWFCVELIRRHYFSIFHLSDFASNQFRFDMFVIFKVFKFFQRWFVSSRSRIFSLFAQPFPGLSFHCWAVSSFSRFCHFLMFQKIRICSRLPTLLPRFPPQRESDNPTWPDLGSAGPPIRWPDRNRWERLEPSRDPVLVISLLNTRTARTEHQEGPSRQASHFG